jgi:hypothetical protein
MHSSDEAPGGGQSGGAEVVDLPAADQPVEEHVHLPPLSIWPVTTAAGVALGGLGMVTDWPFWLLGLLVMGFGAMSWIQELRHEPH